MTYAETWDAANSHLWRLCKTVWLLTLAALGAISAYVAWMVALA